VNSNTLILLGLFGRGSGKVVYFQLEIRNDPVRISPYTEYVVHTYLIRSRSWKKKMTDGTILIS